MPATCATLKPEHLKITHSTFGHRFEKLCLTQEQLIQYNYPSYRAIDAGFRLLPPVSKDAVHMASIMCEFCKTEFGMEACWVIVLDDKFKPLINEAVKPRGMVLDYLTRLHGIDRRTIDNAKTSLSVIQRKLMATCDQNTVLVGHNLYCDLRAVEIVHCRCADTRILFNGMNVAEISEVVLKRRINSAIDYPSTSLAACLFLDQSQARNLPQRSFGSKQELISRVHSNLMSKYENRLVVPVTTCLRGKDTVRIHCKKWEQLMQIEGLMEQLDRQHPFQQVSLPISMKTKSQKKGFFVYLKFATTFDVKDCLDFIGKGKLYKAEVADRVMVNKKPA